jgi:hypothetical protein
MIARSRALWDKLGYYRRMARGLYSLLRTPPHADPEDVVRRQLAGREEIWLNLVERVVFSRPDHPYHRMFRLAGCGLEDLRASVKRDGLEATLAALHREGVYLAHDEFKGKQQIVRSNQVIEAKTESFLNPLVRGGMESSSGGSRSAGTRTSKGVPSRLYGEARRWLRMREHGVADRTQVTVKPVLPAGDGLMNCVVNSRLGFAAGPWFSTMTSSLDAAHYRFATNCLVTLARAYGEHVPYPECLPHDDYSPVSEWISRRRSEKLALVSTYPSPAARVASAALEKGHDIRDTVFFVGGEALTDARRRVIEAAGARVFPAYPISEIGGIGSACSQMTTGNSVHVYEDAVAVISYRRRAPLSDTDVDSLLFTTLLEHGAYLLINVEMDDCGIIEDATCDCSYSRMGFRRRIRDIASYGKLTGVGVTLVGTDVVRILEEVLPARFGGSAMDYQVVELDDQVQARLELRVSRRVQLQSLDEVKDCFLRELRQFQGGAGASRIWRDTAALAVVHEDPLVTMRGKVLPLHLMGTGRKKSA